MYHEQVGQDITRIPKSIFSFLSGSHSICTQVVRQQQINVMCSSSKHSRFDLLLLYLKKGGVLSYPYRKSEAQNPPVLVTQLCGQLDCMSAWSL